VPLDAIHPHAHDAARGAVCGEKLGKGDEMADKLFEVPVDELTPAGIGDIAAGIGLERAAFDKCVADPSTEQAITIDKTDFQIAGGRGLPLLWIDAERILGARPPEDLEAALQRALASDPRAAIR
jgi:predicted DsbA family dithiol-disulfide isomerase